MDFLDILNRRKSVRKFRDKKIDPRKIKKILQAVNSAPSAGNLQAYKIFQVEKKEIRERVADVALGQDFIAQAPLVLVFFADPKISSRRYGRRGEALYSVQDATIAATFAWLSAVDEGLSACWVGAFDGERLKQILTAREDLKPVVILPVGFPAEAPTSPPRRNLSGLVHEI